MHKVRKPVREQIELAKESKEEVWKLATTTTSTSTCTATPGVGIEKGKEEKDIAMLKESEKSFMDKIYFDGGENAYPSPPESPDQPLNLPSTTSPTTTITEEGEEPLTERLTRLLEVQKSPLLCGRRMFLSSLISASKYLQDRTYSNKAWSKISGLGIEEINRNEKCFLELIEWDLHLKASDFKRWTDRLNTLTTTTTTCSSRQGLVRSSSEYLPTPETSLPLVPIPIPTPTSSATTLHPTTSNLVRSKQALTRGSSEPQLEFTKSLPSTSSTGSRSFPIAQPISSSSKPIQSVPQKIEEVEMRLTEGEEEEEEKKVEPIFVSHHQRKVRKLPTRRSHYNGVPLNWVAGSSLRGVVGGGGELISVH